MSEYEFRAMFRAPVIDDLDIYAEALELGSCDDALVGVSESGLIELNFERDESSAEGAMRSAVADVMAAIPNVKFIEIAPDYVGISEIARMLGVSRQHIRRLWVEDQYNAPQPIHQSSSAVWRYMAILPWLQGQIRVENYDCLMEVATAATSVNNSLQSCKKIESTKDRIERYTNDGSLRLITNYQFVTHEYSEPVVKDRPSYKILSPPRLTA